MRGCAPDCREEGSVFGIGDMGSGKGIERNPLEVVLVKLSGSDEGEDADGEGPTVGLARGVGG